MAKQSPEGFSPSASSTFLPFDLNSRRGSVASISSRAHLDKSVLGQALDDIHSTASRSEIFTTFNDFAAPPPSSLDDRNANSHSSGLGGFYSRFKSSVGGPRERPGSASSSAPGTGDREPSFAQAPTKRVPRSKLSYHVDDQTGSPLAGSGTLQSSTASRRRGDSSGRSSQKLCDDKHPEKQGPQSARLQRISNHTLGEPTKLIIASEGERDTKGERVDEPTLSATPENAASSSRNQLSPKKSVLSVLDRGRDMVNEEFDLLSVSDTQQDEPSRGKDRGAALPTSSEEGGKKASTRPHLKLTGDSTLSVARAQSQGEFATTEANGSPRVQSPNRLQTNTSEMQPSSSTLMNEMRRKVLSRDFWMKDENAKVCFSCGDSFTTFRRKHHCRTCGQIYDAKCTVLIDGKPFGQGGRLRICKTCENIIVGDESSEYSEDEEPPPPSHAKQIRFSGLPPVTQHFSPPKSPSPRGHNMASNASRKAVDNRRRTLAVSTDDTFPPLARPSSSRSLKSVTSRPRSSSQRFRSSRHQHMRSLRSPRGDGLHFQQAFLGSRESLQLVGHPDNVVDPDLAPFMSDENPSDGEQAHHASRHDEHSTLGFTGLLGAIKKGKPGPSSRGVLDIGQGVRDSDAMSISSIRPGHRRQFGSRTLSSGSIVGRSGLSPRVIRSENLFTDHQRPTAWASERGPEEGPETTLQWHRCTEQPADLDEDLSYAELDRPSLEHVKNLLRQFLNDHGVKNIKRWVDALIPILLRCAESVDPNIHRGDDIDIRQYVKLKKAPGGRPSDSTYVPGVVFTKNIVLKDMRRTIKNARMLLISFPLVYAPRRQHFTSLEPVIAQEREYLTNLVSRISALSPDVILVRRDVSGLATHFLREANISVASNVKDSVLQAISRCAQTPIISSVDKLTMDPRYLGECQNFEVKTFRDHGFKKSLIIVSGCQKDLGCTILLRGSNTKTLAKLKWITEFMCFVVYNLKLETSLFRDQFVSQSVPTGASGSHQRTTADGTPAHQGTEVASVKQPQASTDENDYNADDESGSVRPFKLHHVPRGKNGLSATTPKNDHTAVKYSKMVHELQHRILSISPAVHLAEPYLLLKCQDQEREMNRLFEAFQAISLDADQDNLEPKYDKFQLVTPEMVLQPDETLSGQLKGAIKAIKKVEFERAAKTYGFLQRRWEAYIAGAVDPFNPWSHQEIVILFSIISTATADACEGPDLLGLDFYQEHDVDVGLEPDVPLGEYIERICHQERSPCTAGRCDGAMIQHYRQYVHGDGQVNIYVDRLPSKMRGMRNTILMWSFCTRCNQETPITPMSVNSWKYSFAKYLEMIFWGRSLVPRAGVCPHNIHRDHIRFFGFKDLAVRVEYHPINVMEVIVPNGQVSWKVEKDIMTKNNEYLRIDDRLNRFMSSIFGRIESIKLDNVDPEKIDDCHTELDRFKERAREEHVFLSKKLREKYIVSSFFEIIPLNRAVRALQEKVAAWDTSFAEFENKYLPSERDLGKLAAQQLKKVYLGRTDVSQNEESDESDENGSELKEKIQELVATNPRLDSISDKIKEQIITQQAVLSPAKPLHIPADGNEDQSLDKNVDQNRNESELVDKLDLALPRSPISSIDTADRAKEELKAHPIDTRRAPLTAPPSREQKSVSTLDPSIPPKSTRSESTPDVRKAFAGSEMQPNPTRSHRQSNGADTTTEAREGSGSGKPPQASMIPVPVREVVHHRKVGSDDQTQTRAPSATSSTFKAQPRSKIPRSMSRKGLESRVSALARHFEQLSRDFEKQRLRERRQRANRMQESQVYPTASVRPVVEFYRDAHEAVQERDPSVHDSSNKNADNQSSQQETRVVSPSDKSGKGLHEYVDGSMEELKNEGSNLLASNPASDLEDVMSDSEHMARARDQESEKRVEFGLASAIESSADLLEIPKHDKSSIMKLLTSFWSERSASGWATLDYPLTASDHIFADSDIIVREDEPSSLVAFALASQDYSDKLKRFRERAKVGERVQADERQFAKSADDSSIERTLLGDKATHMKYQFQAGPSRMQCKIFYAESFDAIRQRCGVADRFVESLSRCVKWDSKGGKTKSMFLKTLDERFVIKSLSAVETQAFLRFAPDYFDYMSKCLFHGLPSALAKMLGVYQVVIKNPATGADLSCFLQVMENVFYEGPSNRLFDLKGSMRNRKAHSTGEKNEVLLDENLLDYLAQSQVYVRNHSYNFLGSSISNDTLFCSKQNVMDYSLIVGLYDGRQELIVGIIDYIRTYTWDKKVESWIKDRGKHKPTVRSPKEYRNRFRASIARYFPLAPSCWQVFGTQRIEQPTAWWDSIGVEQDVADHASTIADDFEMEVQPE